MQKTLFPSEVGLDVRYRRFQEMKLGQLRSVLPIKELAAQLPNPKNNMGGAKPWFNNEGKIALQFLKSYEKCSDERLLERINTDWSLQFFCGISLGPNEEIKDKDLIWQIRAFIGEYLDIPEYQKVIIDKWKPDMEDTQTGLTDATCYESYIKYPTDVKLLWDCIEWLHKQMKYWCKKLGIKRPRNKYSKHASAQKSYAKRKRKTYKLRRRRVRLLLDLCNKILFQLEGILVYGQSQQGAPACLLERRDWDRYMTIGKIYEQQRYIYENPKEPFGDRIVSLYKPYLHPIVRGKENKRVEFGAKVNSWQVDGLNFIEHLSFRAYHEGNRLKNGIAFHQKHFGKLRRIGADQIYATNANRSFCSKFNMDTNFKPKGRAPKDPAIRKQKSQMRALIGKARSTVLEGSYGNDKNHYGLRKIKARNEKTELVWLFFGMMTANGVKMANRKIKNKKLESKSKVPPNQRLIA